MPERPILFSDPQSAAGEQLLLGAEGDMDGHVLEISFDEMSQNFKQYTYTVRHCDASGKPDNLASVEYLDGFTTQDFRRGGSERHSAKDYGVRRVSQRRDGDGA